MALSKDLISQFAKITKDTNKNSTKTEKTVFGTVVDRNGEKYVQFDGSTQLTPVTSTTNIEAGERVTVMIKDHSAIITGNITSPTARDVDVVAVDGKITDFHILLADKVTTDQLNATNARIEDVEADNVKITESLSANEADIEDLKADNVEITKSLTAVDADIESLKAKDVEITGELTAVNANIASLQADNLTVNEKLVAMDAEIDQLAVGDLSGTYATIDFANITKAAMQYFYSQSGLIQNVVIGDATISGNLVGVTISGDLIEGNTVVAEKLVIKGEDGLYYKLNTDGISVESEQTDHNSLNGSVIKAKSITATKISVSDLVAFDATIGGFNITDSSIYSGVKSSVSNTTKGLYLDKDGQIAIGDASNFIKYYVGADGNYRLLISADSIAFGSDKKSVETAIDDAAKTATNFVEYDSTNGLQVGNKTSGSWSGFRTQITSAAFNILNAAGTTLASYGEKLIELGKNATDAIIKLCGGKGQIEYVSDDSVEYLQFSADKVRVKGKDMASVYSMYTDESSRWEKSAVNVTPTKVDIYASECIDSTLVDVVEGWNTSEIAVNPDNVDISSPGPIYLNGSEIRDKSGLLISLVEQGTSGIWTYRKWSNGDVELHGSYSVSNLACTAALGGMYRTDAFSVGSFPFTVYSPMLTASYESAGYGAMLWATTLTSTTQPPSYYLIRPTSATIASGKIIFHVTGKWTN